MPYTEALAAPVRTALENLHIVFDRALRPTSQPTSAASPDNRAAPWWSPPLKYRPSGWTCGQWHAQSQRTPRPCGIRPCDWSSCRSRRARVGRRPVEGKFSGPGTPWPSRRHRRDNQYRRYWRIPAPYTFRKFCPPWKSWDFHVLPRVSSLPCCGTVGSMTFLHIAD